MGFSIGGWNPFNINSYTDPVKDVAKVVIKGVATVADDVLGIDDSGGIVGSVEKVGSKIEDGLIEVGDEIKKASENPYVQMAVAVFAPQYYAYFNAATKLNSGEKLNAADIAAVLATAGQQNVIDGFSISADQADMIRKMAYVADADDPATALIGAFGSDVISELGLDVAAVDALKETGISDTASQFLVDHAEKIRDGARYATGDLTASDLKRKYGDEFMSVLSEYGRDTEVLKTENAKILEDLGRVALGSATAEEIIADRYGNDIATALGAESENERAAALGTLTTLTQKARGVDDQKAVFAGLNRAYDEGAHLNDLQFDSSPITDYFKDKNIDFDLAFNAGFDIPDLEKLETFAGWSNTLGSFTMPDFLKGNVDWNQYKESLGDWGVDWDKHQVQLANLFDFKDLNLSGRDAVDLNFDLNKFNLEGLKPSDLDLNIGELQDLGYELGDLNLDLDAELKGLLLARAKSKTGSGFEEEDEEIASLESDFDFQPTDPLLSRAVLSRSFS